MQRLSMAKTVLSILRTSRYVVYETVVVSKILLIPDTAVASLRKTASAGSEKMMRVIFHFGVATAILCCLPLNGECCIKNLFILCSYI